PHAHHVARLRGDLSLAPPAVEEFLRYDAPVQHATFRVTTVPVELGGVEIPALEQVLVLLAAADRDPSRFAWPRRPGRGPGGQPPPRLRPRRPLLPGGAARPPRGPDRLHLTAEALPRHGPGRGSRGPALEVPPGPA